MKILAFADANFLAHVSRVLEVTKILRETYGHEIIFAGDGTFTKLPAEAGIEVDHVLTVARNATLKLANRAHIVNYRWWRDIVMQSIESDVAVINRHRPDAVIGDMHWSLSISTELTKVPYISITNAHWTNYFSFPWRAFDGHFMTRYMGVPIATRLLPFFKRLVTAYWSLPYWKYRRDHGLPMTHCHNLFEVIEGDLTLIADVPSYGPMQGNPLQMHYVGPILWEPDMPDPEWLSKIDPDRPTLYITMGSTGDPLFFEKAARFFGDTRYQVIMTTGGLPVDIPSIPDNFFVQDFARGDKMVALSDVVINHGGNGSIYQALAGGVPVIGAPYHVDQDLNLQQVEKLGCGIQLSNDKNLFPNLERAIQEILTSVKYRKAAVAVQRQIHEYGGAARAAEIVDAYLRA